MAKKSSKVPKNFLDYVTEWNSINNGTLTTTTMLNEIRAHKPYMLLARKAFLLSFGLYETIGDEYFNNLRQQYVEIMAQEYNHTVPESGSLILSTSLVLLSLLSAI